MKRFGDDQAGFSIEYDPAGRTITVAGWGFWSVDVALAFGKTVTEACREQPRGAKLTMDMSGLKPMRDEGQNAFSEVMRALPALGISVTSIVTDSVLTKLQLVRLASESRAGASVQWLARANEAGRNA